MNGPGERNAILKMAADSQRCRTGVPGRDLQNLLSGLAGKDRNVLAESIGESEVIRVGVRNEDTEQMRIAGNVRKRYR